jgi:hypothetical protein
MGRTLFKSLILAGSLSVGILSTPVQAKTIVVELPQLVSLLTKIYGIDLDQLKSLTSLLDNAKKQLEEAKKQLAELLNVEKILGQSGALGGNTASSVTNFQNSIKGLPGSPADWGLTNWDFSTDSSGIAAVIEAFDIKPGDDNKPLAIEKKRNERIQNFNNIIKSALYRARKSRIEIVNIQTKELLEISQRMSQTKDLREDIRISNELKALEIRILLTIRADNLFMIEMQAQNFKNQNSVAFSPASLSTPVTPK